MNHDDKNIETLLEGFTTPEPDDKNLQSILEQAQPFLAEQDHHTSSQEPTESKLAIVIMFALAACALIAVLILRPNKQTPQNTDSNHAVTETTNASENGHAARSDEEPEATAPRKKVTATYDNGHPFYAFMDAVLDQETLTSSKFRSLLHIHAAAIKKVCGSNPSRYYDALPHVILWDWIQTELINGTSSEVSISVDISDQVTTIDLNYNLITTGASLLLGRGAGEEDIDPFFEWSFDIKTLVPHSKYKNLAIPFEWKDRFYILGLETGVNYLIAFDHATWEVVQAVADKPFMMQNTVFSACGVDLPFQKFIHEWMNADLEWTNKSLIYTLDKFDLGLHSKQLNPHTLDALPHLDKAKNGMQEQSYGTHIVTLSWNPRDAGAQVNCTYQNPPNQGLDELKWSATIFTGYGKARHDNRCFLFLHESSVFVFGLESNGRYMVELNTRLGKVMQTLGDIPDLKVTLNPTDK